MELSRSIYDRNHWYTRSSKGDTLTDIIKVCFHGNTHFPVLPVVFNILVDFNSEKLSQGKLSTLNAFICLLDPANNASLKNIKMARQKKPEKPLTLGRSETQYVAIVT